MRINCPSFGRVAVVVLIVVGANATVRAQSGIGHVSGGPAVVRGLGNRDFAWQVGGGGEKLSGPVGIGGDVEVVYFPEVTKTFGVGGVSSSPSTAMLALSFNSSFYFGDTAPDRRARPFVTGGVTLLVGQESMPLLHVAGGFDWWATRRTGLRFEVRGLYPTMLALKCGVVFR